MQKRKLYFQNISLKNGTFGKQKITVKPKKGWELVSIGASKNQGKTFKTIKNGAKVPKGSYKHLKITLRNKGGHAIRTYHMLEYSS